MAEPVFSIDEAWGFGWQTMKKNFWFFAGVLFFIIGISMILSLAEDMTSESHPLLSILLSLVYLVFSTIMGIGTFKVFLRFLNEGKGRFSDLWTGMRYFFKYLCAEIIRGVLLIGVWLAAGLLMYFTVDHSQWAAMWVGIIFLGLPGLAGMVFIGLRQQFAPYLVVDKGMGPFKALKESWAITRGLVGHLFAFGLLMAVVNLLGILALFVGILFTWPATMLAYVNVYRKLEPASSEVV